MSDDCRSKADLLQELQELRERLRQTTEALKNAATEHSGALPQSEERFRNLVESSVDWMWEVDSGGSYTYVGPQVETILGYKPEEVIGLTPFDLMPPDEAQRVAELFQEHVSSKIPFITLDNLNRHKDGHLVVLETNAIAFYDKEGNLLGFRGVDRDVTERERTREALRSSQEKYRVLVEASPDAVIMANLQGRITFASQRLLDLYDADNFDEVYGRDPLDFVAPDDRQRFEMNVRRTVKQGITRDIEYQFLRKDGTQFPGETSAVVIRDDSGNPTALMALVRDITERKQAQEAVKKEQDSLRRMLRASDRERQLITYEIHDGVAQRLIRALMHFQSYQKSEQRETVRGNTHFESGLKSLREASAESRRLMNRTRTPVFDKYGIATAIADLIDHFMEMPDAPEITYHSDVRFNRLAPVLENTLYRVAQEAIANACLHSKSKTVRVTLRQVDDDLNLQVQDWGIGFDQAQTREDRYGLAGVRERVRLLGKGLVIESTPGVGTRIDATFSLLEANRQGDRQENDAGQTEAS